ncbi:MAG: phosphate starvation-inducible protein PsiF [Afipia felis]|nr:phosphate starvation-inducible protein PsiF [Afipia felis]
MTFLTRAIGTAFVVSLLAGPALAQAPTSPAPAAKTKAEKPRSAVSLDCSKQADAKGLHGKERHKFRSKCKHDAATK